MKLRELAERLACRLEGDGEIEIVRVAGIEDAGPGDLTFVANPKYLATLATTRASAVLLHAMLRLRPRRARAPSASRHLRSCERRIRISAFARAVGLFAPRWKPSRRARDGRGRARCAAWRTTCRSARSSRSARARPSAIAPSSFPTSRLAPARASAPTASCTPTSSIRERVTIGDRVVLQNGVVIGGDGYGFVRRGDGTHEKIPQVATVVIEDDVELGANTTVDRPAVGETRIKAGTKIDNLVQIAHGVIIGRNVLMAAQVGIAGSTEIGDDVMFGGQVGVGGHLTIGRGVVAVGQSGITNSVEPGAMIAGYPAIDAREWRRAAAVFRRLPELKKRIEELEAKLAELRRARKAPSDSSRSLRARDDRERLARCGPGRDPVLPALRLPPAAPSTSRSDDPRFVWDTNFGGELDFVDYGLGRTTFAANYEAVLGEEFRRFDPNQGNYLLDLSTSARAHGVRDCRAACITRRGI